jgi:hypothetical protein
VLALGLVGVIGPATARDRLRDDDRLGQSHAQLVVAPPAIAGRRRTSSRSATAVASPSR